MKPTTSCSRPRVCWPIGQALRRASRCVSASIFPWRPASAAVRPMRPRRCARLIDLWRVALPVEELFDLAARLGADVPMCLAGRAALVSGVGERLAPAPPLPPCAILLVNPGIPLPTPEVFARRHGAFSPARTLRALDGCGKLRRDAGRARQRPHRRRGRAAAGDRPGARLPAGERGRAACRHERQRRHLLRALRNRSQLAERAAARVPPPWWHHAGTLVGRLAAELWRARPSATRTDPCSPRRFARGRPYAGTREWRRR